MENKNNVEHWIENKQVLQARYVKNLKKYSNILNILTKKIEVILSNSSSNAQVKGRVKGFDAFYRKILLRSRKNIIESPFDYITDIIGMRIVVPFIEDLKNVERHMVENFDVVETEYKSQNLGIREFGYDSIHFLINLPSETAKKAHFNEELKIEIQLRTILQDAWAEVEHELIYKTSIDKIEKNLRRKMLAINATLSLADTTFQEIRDFQKRRYREIQARHTKLMEKVSTIPEKMGKRKKIIELSDHNPDLYKTEIPHGETKLESTLAESHNIDDSLNETLVDAMTAHIENRLDDAVELYTKLITLSPNHFIYNHRGLVYFTLSEYEKAIDDFTEAIRMEPKDTRVYTNRGLTYRMLKKYDLSLKDFEKSIELNPLWPDTFYGRSLTYYDLGDMDNAIKDCDKAIGLKPDFKQASRFKQFLINQMME